MAGYNLGDTLLIKNPREWDERRHLFIIVSDPTSDERGMMLLPCVETLQEYHRDRSCVLEPGQHPFIKHPSVVNYRDTVEMTSKDLDVLVAEGHAQLKEPLSAEVLRLLLDGARATPNLNARRKRMLPE